jgi:uncharacterized protein (DUF2126 family)
VLGETGAIGGTVRYTDSSVERLQVKLTTTDPDRYIVTCNGRRVPLHANGNQRRRRRRRALQGLAAGMALHPVLPVDAPLTFDIFDTWSGSGAGRLRLSRRASRRAQLRDLPCQRQRGRSAQACAFRAPGHTPGAITRHRKRRIRNSQ